MREKIISVGIDIGTSTTQLIFSNITIENMASSFSVPRIEIIDKEIIYRSNIYFTPLFSKNRIDMPKVLEIVEKEYELSGIRRESIKTGAVIITGETARKENASEVLSSLSGFAGDFVVATAGPDLESILSARGAGIDEYTRQHCTCGANFDIGGGTTNIAVFTNGELTDTACFDIGGRLVRVEDQKITYINEKVKKLIQYYHLDILENNEADIARLSSLAQRLAGILEMAAGCRVKDEIYDVMITNKALKDEQNLETISFSGGVADFVYQEYTGNNVFQYGDIGILLGQAIRKSKLYAASSLFRAKETIRATVVGAGTHSTSISGSTITIPSDVFPLKNIPILKLGKTDMLAMEAAIRDKLNWFLENEEQQQVAIAFEGLEHPSFSNIEIAAQAIIKGAKRLIEHQYPLIIVVEKDIGKVLGQTINRLQNNTSSKVVCIDGIRVQNGDYIDIGSPLAGGSVVPVVIKTLIFQ